MMRNIALAFIIVLSAMLLILIYYHYTGKVENYSIGKPSSPPPGQQLTIKLPTPEKYGQMTVEEAISKRRSIRSYKDEPLTLFKISQLLWAAQGITSKDGKRAAPSAGATYPIELYLVVGAAENLEPGVYHYNPQNHSLTLVFTGDVRTELMDACLGQDWVGEAPVSIVICAVYERTTARYGERGVRYVHIEVGCVCENIYLEATSLGLGTVAVGAFYDDEVANILQLPESVKPLLVMPVGIPLYG